MTAEYEVEVVTGSAGRHKLTVSPSQRRVTLKIASDADSVERERAIVFLRQVAYNAYKTATTSLRGTVNMCSTSVELYTDARVSVGIFGS